MIVATKQFLTELNRTLSNWVAQRISSRNRFEAMGRISLEQPALFYHSPVDGWLWIIHGIFFQGSYIITKQVEMCQQH
jgi:hypothetical protein